MQDDPDHAGFLQRAIERACRSVQEGGGPFGAVVVDAQGRVLAEAANRVTLWNDPTAHAEVVAIREACQLRGSPSLEGAVLYASCEPCPMCLGAILWARLDRVVFAADRHDAAAAGFDDSAFHRELAAAPAERRLPVQQIPLESALRPFQDWRGFEGARPY